MRIALVTREYLPETSWGGIATHYQAYVQGLRKLGCEVDIFTQGLESTSTVVTDGVTIHSLVPRAWFVGPRLGGDLGGGTLSTIGLFALSLSRELYRAFSREHHKRPYDVVEGHEHLGVMYFINRHFSNSALLTVVRYQTPYDSLVTRKMANWPRSRLVRFLEYGALRFAKRRIATSHYIDNLVQQDFDRIEPADAIFPNMTVHAFDAESEGAVTKKDKLILFVGRLMPGHKNPDMAAQAFAAIAEEFPDWRIEFAGMDITLSSGETMWNRCEQILVPYGGRYHYHGVIGGSSMVALYRRASILLMPSSIESYGLVAIEAMSQGCIPIVFDETSLPDVVADGGLVCKNGSQSGLTESLKALVSDPLKQQQLAGKCLEIAADFRDPAILAKRNIDFFRGHPGSMRP